MKGWKYRSRQLLKDIFCHQKTIREQTGSAWNFLQPSIQVCRDAYIPYSKINASIFCFLSPQVRINKMVNEHTVDYHPIPSEFTSRIHPLIFLWTPKGSISPEYFLNFFSNLHMPPWLQESFQIHYWKIYLLVKNWICAPSKTFPQVFIITTPGRRKLRISPIQSVLKIYFSSADRGRIIELKIWSKLNLQGYWSQILINSTICNLSLLASVLLCHNLDLSKLKCKGSLT